MRLLKFSLIFFGSILTLTACRDGLDPSGVFPDPSTDYPPEFPVTLPQTSPLPLTVNSVRTHYASSEFIKSEQILFSYEFEAALSQDSNPMNGQTIPVDFLYPEKKLNQNLEISESGLIQWKSIFPFYPYEHETSQFLILRLHWQGKSYLLQILLDIENHYLSPLIEFKMEEENGNQTFVLNKNKPPLIQKIYLDDQLWGNQLKNNFFETNLRISRSTHRGVDLKLYQSGLVFFQYSVLQKRGPGFETLALNHGKLSTDEFGKIKIEFPLFSNLFLDDLENKYFFIKLEIPGISQIEPAYFLISLATNHLERLTASLISE